MNSPFPGGPNAGLTPNLIPNPPPSIPQPPGPGDALASLSPFNEPQDIEAVIKQLQLNRPLKLYIPGREKYPEWEFRIINSNAQEIADATNKGFKQVSHPDLVRLFDSLVAGTDKEGKAMRPLLFARSTKVGDHVRRQYRAQLQSFYAGMDPRNKDLNSRYTGNVDAKDGTKAEFSGAALRIRV